MEFEYMTEETAQRLNKALLSSIAAKEIIIKQLKTMNENINLTKILKDCPKGTKFYSYIFGDETYFQGFSLYEGKPISIIIYGQIF